MTVRQSRSSLEYISSNVSEAMKEIEDDIGKELEITRNLTKLNSKMSLMLGRFNTLEEEVIELVRMDCNMESVKIETPIDINEEVQKVLASKKTLEPPTTPKKLRISTTTFLGTREALQQNPISKFSAPQTSVQLIAANDNSTGSNVIPN
ncbi:uncharacterized protein LOC107266726 isoform X2 [Cephus cinctus]|uniref:Uncharacterized protein LOC107266726 isoform X2 n=1 Tax=Cephus cinctus TaxID=211228 RepID=A0AAJ7FI56_CEPCN|nr:uncharacterized protein LOC107266726 isoform X2 [Cephus cinctus]